MNEKPGFGSIADGAAKALLGAAKVDAAKVLMSLLGMSTSVSEKIGGIAGSLAGNQRFLSILSSLSALLEPGRVEYFFEFSNSYLIQHHNRNMKIVGLLAVAMIGKKMPLKEEPYHGKMKASLKTITDSDDDLLKELANLVAAFVGVSTGSCNIVLIRQNSDLMDAVRYVAPEGWKI